MLEDMLFYGQKEEECGMSEFMLTLDDEIWLKTQNETDKCDSSARKAGAQNNFSTLGSQEGRRPEGVLKQHDVN